MAETLTEAYEEITQQSTSQHELTNQAQLIGTVLSMPVKTQTKGKHGLVLYTFNLGIKRYSEKWDVLPIVIPGRAINPNIAVGNCISLVGQIRTRNEWRTKDNSVTPTKKCIVYVYAKQIHLIGVPKQHSADEFELMDDYESPEDVILNFNDVYLDGCLCKKPNWRTTPLGHIIADVLLAVQRYPNKSDYIPCIVWSHDAVNISKCEAGKRVQIYGRMQSRKYEKKNADGDGITQHVAYEVAVAEVVGVDE